MTRDKRVHPAARRGEPRSPRRPAGALSRMRTHRWVRDACLRCGLRRREVWVLDDGDRAVLALVWSDAGGDVRWQPFPPMLGLLPPTPPGPAGREALRRVPVGPEPACVPAGQPKRPEM